MLLGTRLLAQIGGVIQMSPPRLTLISDTLHKVSVPLDFSGLTVIHQAYMFDSCLIERITPISLLRAVYAL